MGIFKKIFKKMRILLSLLFDQKYRAFAKEKENVGFFPGVPEIECECAINVRLKGDQRVMTWSDSAACPYPSDPQKVYDPYSVGPIGENRGYKCRVKGGHCIDITYFEPHNISQMYNGNTSYCHERSCAKQVFRMRGCVASDDFILQVYKANKPQSV